MRDTESWGTLHRPAFESLEPRLLLSGTIEGQVWEDLNGDGRQDIGDVGVNGWAVELVDVASGSVVDTQVTGEVDLDLSGTIDPQTEAGLYTFANVAVGSYSVRQVPQAGWVQTSPLEPTGELSFVQVLKDGVGGVDGLAGAHSVTVSGDGAHVYAAGYYDNAVAVFARDAVTGELSFVQVLKDDVGGVDGLSRARSVTVSGDGAHVYAAGYYDNAVAVFARDAATGELSFIQMLKDGVGGVDGLDGAESVTVSGDGAHAYVAGANDDAVAVFARDVVTGELSFVQVLKDGVGGVDGLDYASSVTVSGDGAHVYAASYYDDAVAVFSRDAVTGELSFVQVLKDGVGTVDGLNGARSVTVSGDGAHVYAASSLDDAVAVFARDAATGELSFVEMVKQYVGGAFSATVSGDGAHVFAASIDNNAVAVFARDAVTGELSFVEAIRDGVGGVDGLYSARSVTVSGDGAHVYAAGFGDNAVAVFERIYVPGPIDVEVTGDVVIADVNFGVADAPNVSGQVFGDADNDGVRDGAEVGQDGWTVELVMTDTGRVIATRVTASVDLDESGTIDPVSETGLYSFADVSPGSYEVRLVVQVGWEQTTPAVSYALSLVSGDVDAGGLDYGVFMMGSISGQVFADRNSDGLHDAGDFGLDGWTVELVDVAGALVVATQTTAGVDLDSNGIIDPDTEAGLYLFGDLIPRDYEVRQVLPTGWTRTVPADSHLVSLAVGQDVINVDLGNIAYGTIEGQIWEDFNGDGVQDIGDVGVNGWTVELVDAASGSVVDTQVTAGVDLDESGTIDPQTEAGLYAFASVAVGPYSVRQVLQAGWVQTSPLEPTGELSFVEVVRDGVGGVDGLNGPWSVTVSGDGAHVYAASSLDDAVAVFARDAATGELSFIQMLKDGVGGVDGLYSARSVTVTGDGAHVYTAGIGDDAVSVFERNAVTGELSFVQVLKDGVGGVDGLDGAWSVTVSGDGTHVYAAGAGDDAVAVFARSAVTGELSFVQVLKDGVGGVDGLNGVESVTVSGDGAHVYAASSLDDAVAVFARDAATGELSFIQMLKDGVGGVDGLDYASSVTVSGDGAHVYAAGYYDDAVAVFARDVVTGELSFVQVLKDGVGGVDGLAYARSVTVSGDGAHVYAAGYVDDAVAVFARDAATGELGFVQVLKDGVGGVDGLDGAYSVTVSGDGAHVYAAGGLDDAVAVLERIYAPGPADVEVTASQIVMDVDFGVVDLVTVGGQIFWDRDSDGLHNVGERGLNGWTVELVDTGTGEVAATAITTNVDLNEDGMIDIDTEMGLYEIADVVPGDYQVRLVLQAGWVQVSPVGPYSLSLTSGSPDAQNQNFAMFLTDPAEISGQVWEDLNGDGLHDAGEPGLDGWTVELVEVATQTVVDTQITISTDLNADGVIDPETERGLYAFLDLAPGKYEVRQVVPAGWKLIASLGIAPPDIQFHIHWIYGDWFVEPFAMVPVWDDNDWLDLPEPRPGVWKMNDDYYDAVWQYNRWPVWTGPGGFNPEALVAYTPGSDENVYWFVVEDYHGGTACLQCNFHDLDVQIIEDYEPGQLLLTAYHEPSAQAYHAIIGPDGAEYVVPQGESIALIFDTPGVITLDVGQAARDVDFGNVRIASLAGQKFEDLNGNGRRDSGEVGLDGWTVELVNVTSGETVGTMVTASVDLNGDGVIDPETEAGLYSFDGLLPGTHVVREVVPAAWGQTAPFLATAGRVFVMEDGDPPIISEIDPATGAVLNSFSAPEPGVVTGAPLLAVGNDRLFFVYTRYAVPSLAVVHELDLDTGDQIGFSVIEHGAYSYAEGVAFLDGLLYVIRAQDDTVVAWDPATGTTVDTIDLGAMGFSSLKSLTAAEDLGLLLVSAIDDSVGGSAWRVIAIDPATASAMYVVDLMVSDENWTYRSGEILEIKASTDPAYGSVALRYDPMTGAYLGKYWWEADLSISSAISAQKSPGVHRIDVYSGDDIESVDFGNWQMNVVSGQVFGDLDGNGVRDGDEVGVDGWTVELVDTTTGGVIAMATTASEDLNADGHIDPASERGRYVFTGVPQGDYEIRQIVPAGWQQTAPMFLEERAFAAEVVGGAVTVHEFNPADGAILNSFAGPQAVAMSGYQGLAVGPDSLFYVDANDWLTPTLWELDPDTGAVIDSDPLTFGTIYVIKGLAYLDGLLYIQYMPDQVAVWDPASDAFVRTLTISAAVTGGLTGAGDLGVLFDSNAAGEIIAIDPTDGSVLNTFATGLGALDGGLAYAGGELLAVGTSIASLVHRIDPSTGAAAGSFSLGVTGSIVGLGGDMPNLPVPVNHAMSLGPSEVLDGRDFGNLAPAVTGDFNGDGLVDSLDIDLLYANQGDAAFDLDGDGDADSDDMDVLVHDILNTEYGDFNLDGLVNGTDLAIMKVNFGRSGVGWAQANANGDDVVNGTDLAILKVNFGFESSGGSLSVSAPALLGESDTQAEPILASTSVIHQLSPPAAIDEYAIDSHPPLSSGQQVGVESIEAGPPALLLLTANEPLYLQPVSRGRQTSSRPASPQMWADSPASPRQPRVPGAFVRGERRASGIPSPLAVGLSAASVRPPVRVDLTAAATALLQSGTPSVADILGEVEPIF